MGGSFIAEGLLQAHLPKTEWTPLVSKLGYSVGFWLVILGRQQLFTENTLTPVIPLLRHRTARNLANFARLWTVVLGANFLGGFVAAFACMKGNVFDPEVPGLAAAFRRDRTDLGHNNRHIRRWLGPVQPHHRWNN